MEWLIFLFCLDYASCMITYPEFYLSNYCGNRPEYSSVWMGVTPYFENTRKLLTGDSSTVALFKANDSKLKYEVVTNCSVTIFPPDGHSLLVDPSDVINLGPVVGALKIYVDDRLAWEWDQTSETNQSSSYTRVTELNGSVRISLEVLHITTTWTHVSFEVLLTAFVSLGPNEQSCGQVFYYDCGNRRCIREALTCDDYDNCGNNEDETSCGLDALSASLLGGSAIISLVFLLVVLYLDNRPEVVIKLINERLIDDMEHHQVL